MKVRDQDQAPAALAPGMKPIAKKIGAIEPLGKGRAGEKSLSPTAIRSPEKLFHIYRPHYTNHSDCH
jgi:hypothetical protein